jgi:hypothetical protein
VDCSPVQARPRRATGARTPVIFRPEHVERLLGFADQLSDAYGGELRAPTYRTIFAVLYTLGFRVGEIERHAHRITRRNLRERAGLLSDHVISHAALAATQNVY